MSRSKTAGLKNLLIKVGLQTMVDIFLFVPTYDLINAVSLVSKDWNKLVNWEYFWQRKTFIEFPYQDKMEIRYVPVMPGRWKLTYIVEYFNAREKKKSDDETRMWFKFNTSGQTQV